MLAQIKAFNKDDPDISRLSVIEEGEDKIVLVDDGPNADKFTVTEPVKVAGNIKYTCIGLDDEGEFNVKRRFKEFHALANVLAARWPGCYIPAIPEKKLDIPKLSNSEEMIEDRRALLERFMKECTRFDYIMTSQEFKIFTRGQGEVDKVLASMTKQTPIQIVEKYRNTFK